MEEYLRRALQEVVWCRLETPSIMNILPKEAETKLTEYITAAGVRYEYDQPDAADTHILAAEEKYKQSDEFYRKVLGVMPGHIGMSSSTAPVD